MNNYNDQNSFSKISASTFLGLTFICILLLPFFIMDLNVFQLFFNMKNVWYFKFFIITSASIMCYIIFYGISIIELLLHSIKKTPFLAKEKRGKQGIFKRVIKFPVVFLYKNITNQKVFHPHRMEKQETIEYFKKSEMFFNLLFVVLLEISITLSLHFSFYILFSIIVVIFMRLYIFTTLNYLCFMIYRKYNVFIIEQKKEEADKKKQKLDKNMSNNKEDIKNYNNEFQSVIEKKRSLKKLNQAERWRKTIYLLDQTIDTSQMTREKLQNTLLTLRIGRYHKKIDTTNMPNNELRIILRGLRDEERLAKIRENKKQEHK